MIPENLVAIGNCGNIIRVLSAYGKKRAEEIGEDKVYDFTIGSPSIDPPAIVFETLDKIMKTVPATKRHSYSNAPGLDSTRKAFADYLTKTFGHSYRGEDIYITHGASSALAILARALICPGDEAVILAPYYPEYTVYVKDVGGRIVVANCTPGDFQIDLDEIDKAVNEKTSFIIVNSPNNPSGVIYTAENIKALAELLNKKEAEYGHPIYIIADEPYRELCYGVEVPFIPNFYKNTVYVYSFSKSLSLPGERMGFIALAPEIDNYLDLRAAVFGASRVLGNICASNMFQMICAECIGHTADISKYDENRNALYAGLKECGFDCVKPDGAFYLFVKSPVPDANEFCKFCMDKDVLVVPGDDFGCKGYVRLAYCVPKSRIENSMPAFKAIAEHYGLK